MIEFARDEKLFHTLLDTEPAFIVDTRLGKGSYGDVYRAKDLRDGRRIALKLGLAQDEPVFQHEIEIAQGLSHPFLLAGQEYGSLYRKSDRSKSRYAWSGSYLTMELGGPSLEQRLEELALSQVVRIGDQIGQALAYLHDKEKILHLDVNPSNILLGKKAAQLCDFGLARKFPITDGLDLPMGTPKYSAPEQKATKPVPRSDTYCLAATVYTTITGTPPLAVSQTRNAVPIRNLLRDWDERYEGVEDVLNKGLSYEPDQRPAPAEFGATLVTAYEAATGERDTRVSRKIIDLLARTKP